MLQGISFVHGRDVMEAIMQIKRAGPYVPDGASDISRRIVKECMMLRPNDRIKVQDILDLLDGKEVRVSEMSQAAEQSHIEQVQAQQQSPPRPSSNYQLTA